MAKPAPCLQHPDRPARCRGRCNSCYQSIMRMMAADNISDAEAVKKRWLLPKRRPGRKPKDKS